MMSIYELSTIMRHDIVWRRYSNQKGRHVVQIEGSEIAENGMLLSTYGNGDSPGKALEDYVRKIKGKKLVTDAGNLEKRQEYGVPLTLTV